MVNDRHAYAIHRKMRICASVRQGMHYHFLSFDSASSSESCYNSDLFYLVLYQVMKPAASGRKVMKRPVMKRPAASSTPKALDLLDWPAGPELPDWPEHAVTTLKEFLAPIKTHIGDVLTVRL